MSANTAYKLRAMPHARAFRAAWDAALAASLARLADLAMERCRDGTTQPVYSHGRLVGERTVYSDRLLMFMLSRRSPNDHRLTNFPGLDPRKVLSHDDLLGKALVALDAQLGEPPALVDGTVTSPPHVQP